MSKDKISRKDMKENELEHALVGARDYVVSHEATAKKWTAIGVGAVVLVALVWGGLVLRARRLDARLSTALGVFDAPLATDGAGTAARRHRLQGRRRTARGREEAAPGPGRRRPGLEAGTGGPDDAPRARRRGDALGEAPRRRARPGEAGPGLDRLGRRGALLPRGRGGRGAGEGGHLRRQGLTSSASDPPLPKDVLLFTLARLYEKDGQLADAKASYQRIVSDYPDSPMRFEAQQKAQGL